MQLFVQTAEFAFTLTDQASNFQTLIIYGASRQGVRLQLNNKRLSHVSQGLITFVVTAHLKRSLNMNIQRAPSLSSYLQTPLGWNCQFLGPVLTEPPSLSQLLLQLLLPSGQCWIGAARKEPVILNQFCATGKGLD